MADDSRDVTSQALSGQSLPGGASGTVQEKSEKTYATFQTPTADLTTSSSSPEKSQRPTMTDALRTVKPEDLTKVHQTPCAREAFLTGIGAGFGFGGIRGILGAPVMKAANWAVGGFMLGGIISFEYCLYRRRVELEQVRRAVEIMDRKKIEKEQKILAAKKRREEADAAKKAEEQKKSWKFW